MRLSFPYRVSHIPRTTPHNRRPGIALNYTTITIHSTANPRSTAQNERDWLVNTSNKRTASWHIAVDDRQAVEAIPLNEVAWHAGDATGNRSSMGIEICESGNRERTVANTVELVVQLLSQRNWDVDKLKRHYDWSRKICPRIFVDNNWAGWRGFLGRISNELSRPVGYPEITRRVAMYLRGESIDMDGYLIDGTTYVPVRFFAQSLGRRVDWDSNTYSVDIR